MGEAGGSSESEFSSEKSSTRALRPRMDSGRGARLQENYAVKLTHVSAPHHEEDYTTHNAMLSRGMNTRISGNDKNLFFDSVII